MNRISHRYALCSIIALLVLLTHCSEPPPPGPAPPPAADTTTHDYTWEYHLFGQSPVAGSWFRDIYVESDDNFWIVGDVHSDTLVPSAGGNRSHNVAAVHWDGNAFTVHAIDVMKISGSINTGPIYAVEGRDGSVYFMSGLSCTELRSDSFHVHDLRILNGRWPNQRRMDKFSSGRMYIYGGPGFAAELVQDKPLGPISFRQIPLSTELPVATFAEAAPDDYYMGLWWTNTAEYHFWRHYKGERIPLQFARTTDGPRDFCTSLWASEKYLYATTYPYLFRQSISDTSDRVFLNIYNDTGPGKPLGRPFRMTGRADNDIFIVGDAGTAVHYNGSSFHLYKEIKEVIPTGRLYDVAVTRDKVYIVGGGYVNGLPRAVLFIGTRRQGL
jgi:hypothetical protein